MGVAARGPPRRCWGFHFCSARFVISREAAACATSYIASRVEILLRRLFMGLLCRELWGFSRSSACVRVAPRKLMGCSSFAERIRCSFLRWCDEWFISALAKTPMWLQTCMISCKSRDIQPGKVDKSPFVVGKLRNDDICNALYR